MDRKLRMSLVGALFFLCCLAAVYLSVGSAIVIALTGGVLAGVWQVLEKFFPAEPAASEKVAASQLPPSRRPTQPNVLNVRPPTPRPRQQSFTERQWSALANVLKTPSRTNLQKIGGGAKPPPSPQKAASLPAPPKPLTEADFREKLLQRQDELGLLIQRSRKRVDEQDNWIKANVGLVTQEGLQALTDAKRVIDALQKRFDRTHEFLQSGSFRIESAEELLELPLTVDDSVVNHLTSAKAFRPLAPEEWESTLQILIKKVSRKKSLSGREQAFPPIPGK